MKKEEENVMETSIMHLCIPDYEKKKKDGLIVTSECSYNALNILFNDMSDRECAYHFPVYDIHDEPYNVVIVRNLESDLYRLIYLENSQLTTLVNSITPVVSITPSHPWTDHGVVKVVAYSADDALMLKEQLNGQEFNGRQCWRKET